MASPVFGVSPITKATVSSNRGVYGGCALEGLDEKQPIFNDPSLHKIRVNRPDRSRCRDVCGQAESRILRLRAVRQGEQFLQIVLCVRAPSGKCTHARGMTNECKAAQSKVSPPEVPRRCVLHRDASES